MVFGGAADVGVYEGKAEGEAHFGEGEQLGPHNLFVVVSVVGGQGALAEAEKTAEGVGDDEDGVGSECVVVFI